MPLTDKKNYLSIVALLCLAFAPVAAAGDSSAGFAVPGLISDPPGSAAPRTAVVSIKGGTITVQVLVAASAENPGLVIQGPIFGPVAASEPYPDRHFPELVVQIDGVPAPIEEFVTAFKGDRNILLFVRAAHMDPWAITRAPPLTKADGANPRALTALEGLRAIERSGDGYLAAWTARRTVRIALQKGRDQQVELRFSARPAFSPAALDQVVTSSLERDYCLSGAALHRLAHSGPATRMHILHEYTVGTGIDGIAPSSASFEMSPVDGDRAGLNTMIFLCGPHRKSIAAVGTVKRQSADIDEHGQLRVLSLVEAPAITGERE